MIRYRVTGGTLRLHSGAVLALSTAQAKDRAHVLDARGDGVFTAKGTVEFKVGEVVGIEGTLPKIIDDILDPIESSKPSEPEPATRVPATAVASPRSTRKKPARKGSAKPKAKAKAPA